MSIDLSPSICAKSENVQSLIFSYPSGRDFFQLTLFSSSFCRLTCSRIPLLLLHKPLILCKTLQIKAIHCGVQDQCSIFSETDSMKEPGNNADQPQRSCVYLEYQVARGIFNSGMSLERTKALHNLMITRKYSISVKVFIKIVMAIFTRSHVEINM